MQLLETKPVHNRFLTNAVSALLLLPFIVLPWAFDPRLDRSTTGLEKLLRTDYPSKDAVAGKLRFVDPNAFIAGKPLLLKLGIEACDFSVTQQLLDRGANPNKGDPPPLVALLTTSHCSDTEPFVSALLKHGATVNVPNGHRSLLESALINGQPFLVPLLLAAGANPNETPANPHQSLFEMALEKDTEAALALLKAGAQINKSEYVLKSLDEGRPEVFKALSRRGITVPPKALQAHAGRLFAHSKFEGDDDESLRLLLTLKPELNFRLEDGRTPLIAALSHPKTVKLLLDSGASAKFRDAAGVSPIVHSVDTADCSGTVLNLLLAHGADPNETVLGRGGERHSLLGVFHENSVFLMARSPCVEILARAQRRIEGGQVEFSLMENWPKLYKEVKSKVSSPLFEH